MGPHDNDPNHLSWISTTFVTYFQILYHTECISPLYDLRQILRIYRKSDCNSQWTLRASCDPVGREYPDRRERTPAGKIINVLQCLVVGCRVNLPMPLSFCNCLAEHVVCSMGENCRGIKMEPTSHLPRGVGPTSTDDMFFFVLEIFIWLLPKLSITLIRWRPHPPWLRSWSFLSRPHPINIYSGFFFFLIIFFNCCVLMARKAILKNLPTFPVCW